MERDARRVFECVQKLRSGSNKINTTLYDLIEAVMDEVGAGESMLVTLVVLRLLGKAKSPGTSVMYH